MLQYEYCSLVTLEAMGRDWKKKSSEGLSQCFSPVTHWGSSSCNLRPDTLQKSWVCPAALPTRSRLSNAATMVNSACSHCTPLAITSAPKCWAFLHFTAVPPFRLISVSLVKVARTRSYSFPVPLLAPLPLRTAQGFDRSCMGRRAAMKVVSSCWALRLLSVEPDPDGPPGQPQDWRW